MKRREWTEADEMRRYSLFDEKNTERFYYRCSINTWKELKAKKLAEGYEPFGEPIKGNKHGAKVLVWRKVYTEYCGNEDQRYVRDNDERR